MATKIKQAQAGDPEAQIHLGHGYETGTDGLGQDFTEALRWYRRAADQGNAEAQWRLGRLYSDGKGASQDLPEAAKWFRQAALRGHAQAQYKLGNLYRTGTGVPVDHGQAVRWYQEGANRGEVLAQNNLGLMLKNGYGADQDKVRGYLWLHLAALSYLGAADEERYTNVIGSRNQLAAAMTPEEIAEATRLAEAWRPNYQQKDAVAEPEKPLVGPVEPGAGTPAPPGRGREDRAGRVAGQAGVTRSKGPPSPPGRPGPVLAEGERQPPAVDRVTAQASEESRPNPAATKNKTEELQWRSTAGPMAGAGKTIGARAVSDTKSRNMGGDDGEDLPAVAKMAILCVALGPEAAGEVLKSLGEREVEEVTQAIANLKNVSVAQQDKVLAEFEQQMLAGNWGSQGGVDFVRQVLERAKGPQKAQEILDRVTHTATSGFHLLKNIAPDQIAPFISHEHPQTIALILSQLDSAQAAGILSLLPERLQTDVAYRIATLENITPAVLRQIEESLEVSLRSILGGNKEVGGAKVAADILNLTGISIEKQVLDQMDAQDPEVTEAVRNLMFTFTDIVRLNDPEIQILLKEVSHRDLAIALKTADKALKGKVFGNMSERMRSVLSKEMEYLPPMRRSEVEEVQLRIVQQVRQLEEQGQIKVVRDDSRDTFI